MIIIKTYLLGNLKFLIIIKTYLVQLFGAIPFSYYILDPHSVFVNPINKWPATLVLSLPLLVLLATSAIFSRRWRFSEITGDMSYRGIAAVGTLLFVIPPAIISLSPKFQAQTWGDAYLPVYLTYFGLGLLFALGFRRLFIKVSRAGDSAARAMAMASLCFWLLLFAFNLRNNWLVAQTMNRAVWNARVLLEAALDRGLLESVNPKAVFLVNGTEPWDNADEYSAQTGRRFSVYRLDEPRDLSATFQAAGGVCGPLSAEQQVCEFNSDAPVYTVQIRHLTDGTGAVLLSRIRSAYHSNGLIQGLLSNEVTAYFRLPASFQPLTVAVSGQDMQHNAVANIFRSNILSMHVVKEGWGWKLMTLHRNTTFDALSLRGEISSEHQGPSIAWTKSKDEFELHSSGTELIHVGYENDSSNGAELPPINFASEMSLEVLIVPNDSQVQYAEILSNHWTDSRGLAIEQLNAGTNQYSVVFGTSKGWMEMGVLSLAANRRNLISLEVKDREARLYVNGNSVARKMLPEPIAPSPHPLRIGNWKGGDRPFNGWIQEVLIANGAKSEEVIATDAKRLAVDPAPTEAAKRLLLQGNDQTITHGDLVPGGSKGFAVPGSTSLPDYFQ